MTPAYVTAFCPGHISGYFRRVNGHNPATTGSIGAGIVISEGVTATVRSARESSVVVRVESRQGVSREVLRESPPLSSVPRPFGGLSSSGDDLPPSDRCRFWSFCSSAACHTYRYERLFSLNLSIDDIAELAHETEVTFRTGLGDVSCMPGWRSCRKNRSGHSWNYFPQFRS